jgi:small subunit ribosomal protein S1
MSTDTFRPDDSVPAAASSDVPTPDAAPQPGPETAAVESLPAPEQAAEPAPTPSVVAGQPAAPPDETPSPEEVGSAEQPRRKVQLNPTVSPAQARPVPTLSDAGSTSPPAMPVAMPTGAEEEVEAAVQAAVSSYKPAQAPTLSGADPVAMPPAEEIGMDLNDAIAAAMAGSPAAAPATEEQLQPGSKMTGTVVTVDAESVFLDLGQGKTAAVAVRQFPGGKIPEPGSSLQVVIERVDEEEGLVIANIPRAVSRISGDWEFLSPGQIVECMVTKTNKGGLDVNVGSIRGFMPASQVTLGFVADLTPFVGQKLKAKVVEVKPEKRRLVVSHRSVMIEERQAAEKELYEKLQVDEIRSGRVKTIKDYGAFIDLGGVDGFLPIGQISWLRIGHPSEILQEGQEVEVKVTGIDREKKKISLSTRQLAANPWKTAESKYPKGSNVTGRVTRLEAFGAFVELEPGVEGLVHISELDHKRVKRVSEVLNPGDMAEVQVVEVDPGRKRISLSVKALKAKPEPIAPPEEEAQKVEKYERKNKGALKGGIGGTGPGGLFGNPSDFSR